MANYWMQLIHVAEVSDHWSVEEERHGVLIEQGAQ
jgi:hypothetical protein